MKHIKKFESREDNVELLGDLLEENPLSIDHDFYIFLASEAFIPVKDLFKKGINIENMIRIQADSNSVAAMSMLDMRARFQGGTTLYHIWLPKDLRDSVEGKGGKSLEPWLVELINKYKGRGSGSDTEGKRIMKDVIQRRKDINNYNL
jgi:hypothetical protein